MRLSAFSDTPTAKHFRIMSPMTCSAVERQFEIIGKAMTRLRDQDIVRFERITDARKITGFRNALIHGYDAIDDMISWGVITQKLSILLQEINAMLPQL